MDVTRRDALKALAALPSVKNIEVAQIKPGDVIVIEAGSEVFLSQEAAERIKAYVEKAWPGHKCVVFGDGLKMKIARSLE